MNERNFDDGLARVLPLVEKDEKGRWFLVFKEGSKTRFLFFDNEAAARAALEKHRISKRNSN